MRCRAALLPLLILVSTSFASEPTPLEKHLAVQKAMATARQFLDVNMPAEAVATLEAEVANADGNKAFLTLLREAYLAELYRLEKETTPDAERVARIRRSLTLLGGTMPKPTATPTSGDSRPPARPEIPPPSFDTPTPAATPVAVADPTADAVAAFNAKNYTEAAKLFAAAGAGKLTTDQKTAWAYCRVKLANDKLNGPACDAAAVLRELNEALSLAPQHAELQKIGQQVIATARSKANPDHQGGGSSSENCVETASFRVRHQGNPELAQSVSKAAEAARKQIYERWSGPPAGAWDVKCEIVIHASAEAFAKSTGRPAGSTGNATVRLSNGRATERRIDLRADDPVAVTNALPRELTHVVLADLFPDKPPPKWAAEGMAILAGTPDEVGRFTRTLPRCARDGDWFGLAQLLELKDFPTEKITGFYCQSVSLTEYLIRLGGNEKNFTAFLRDCHRYGTPQALKRQYSIDSPQALEAAWKRAALEVGRGQAP